MATTQTRNVKPRSLKGSTKASAHAVARGNVSASGKIRPFEFNGTKFGVNDKGRVIDLGTGEIVPRAKLVRMNAWLTQALTLAAPTIN